MQLLTLIALVIIVYVAARHATNELSENEGKDPAKFKRKRVTEIRWKTRIKRRKLFL
jgi:hypothetical protein